MRGLTPFPEVSCCGMMLDNTLLTPPSLPCLDTCCWKHVSHPPNTPGGPGSVVGIATGYGLGSPGIESTWGRDFPHLSRPALGPTQPPVQWVLGLSRGVKSDQGVTLTPNPF